MRKGPNGVAAAARTGPFANDGSFAARPDFAGALVGNTPSDELMTVWSIYQQAPKWSFHGSAKGHMEPTGTPVGPHGLQDPHRDIHGKYSRDPAWSMPKSASDADIGRPRSAPVGPATYKIKTGPSTPAWGFGSAGRPKFEGSGTCSPGPGVYMPNHDLLHRRGPGWSAGGRSASATCRDLRPGPGAYKLKSTLSAKGSDRWVASHASPGRRRPSSSPGPIRTHEDLGGLRFSIGVRRQETNGGAGDAGLLGSRTQFGY